MNVKKILKECLTSALTLVDELTESDLEKLSSGNYKLSLKVIRSNSNKTGKEKRKLDADSLNSLVDELKFAKSRDEGMIIIEKNLKNKSELETFAKQIDVAIMSNDKVLQIKENIVDATVGARLRSNAIQDKEIKNI